jgi:hypothetical protein
MPTGVIPLFGRQSNGQVLLLKLSHQSWFAWAAIARQPKVVAMTPKIGQKDVDPALKALVFTFDRPMQDGMWAVVGGGEHFPKVGKLSYDQAR